MPEGCIKGPGEFLTIWGRLVAIKVVILNGGNANFLSELGAVYNGEGVPLNHCGDLLVMKDHPDQELTYWKRRLVDIGLVVSTKAAERIKARIKQLRLELKAAGKPVVKPTGKPAVIKISAKCVDLCWMALADANRREIGEAHNGHVPDFMPEDHDGDYVMLDIDIETGRILNWKKPTKKALEATFGKFK